MRCLKRFARGELRFTRIEAFSDGVFAIIVTLLVLELKVPELHDHGNVSQLGHELLALFPKFLSWLISFIIVCKFWLNHHHILSLACHANYGMVWLHSIFLMFQSFIPFPAANDGRIRNQSAGGERVWSSNGGQHATFHQSARLHPKAPDQA
jgi:uncharacterized membrane protein